jgi:hypothetical protein
MSAKSLIETRSTCPNSRLYVQMARSLRFDRFVRSRANQRESERGYARGSSPVWAIANIRKRAAWRDCIMICQLDWLPMSVYFALAGGTMPFIRRYSTIWP